MTLNQKYLALLHEAERLGIPDVEAIRLCFETLSLSTAIDRDCAELLAPHGLSEGRFVLLFLLNCADDGLAPNVLAAQAGVSRATVTGLLDGLEREGLVMRQADVLDRRALRILLTEKGVQLAQTVMEQHSRWIASLFGNFSAAERQQFMFLLSKAQANLLSSAKAK